jgi:hypothetical protein
MKSIRLSLMVYFLGLLAVALLAALLLVYRNAERTLAAKQQAMEQLIQAQYEDTMTAAWQTGHFRCFGQKRQG